MKITNLLSSGANASVQDEVGMAYRKVISHKEWYIYNRA